LIGRRHMRRLVAGCMSRTTWPIARSPGVELPRREHMGAGHQVRLLTRVQFIGSGACCRRIQSRLRLRRLRLKKRGFGICCVRRLCLKKRGLRVLPVHGRWVGVGRACSCGPHSRIAVADSLARDAGELVRGRLGGRRIRATLIRSAWEGSIRRLVLTGSDGLTSRNKRFAANILCGGELARRRQVRSTMRPNCTMQARGFEKEMAQLRFTQSSQCGAYRLSAIDVQTGSSLGRGWWRGELPCLRARPNLSALVDIHSCFDPSARRHPC
jgi:hypothetical protein